MPRFSLRFATLPRAVAVALLTLTVAAGVATPTGPVSADDSDSSADRTAEPHRRTDAERRSTRRAPTSAATIVSVSDPVLWPNPTDEAGPRETVMTYTVNQPGDYTLAVTEGPWIYAELDLGTVEASKEKRTWTWNGLGLADIPVERGTYHLEIVRNIGPTTIDIVATAPVEVHNGTGTREVRDKKLETGAGRADLRWFNIANSPDGIEVEWDFRTGIRRTLSTAEATLDADRARNYQIVLTRDTRGALRATLSLHDPASGAEKAVRCRALRSTVARRRVNVIVPHSCLRIGHRRVRAAYGASTHRGRYRDTGPDGGRTWTGWTAFERRPIATTTA